jgi:hypothetical protein
MPFVEEYWNGAVRRLQTEVDVFNRLIGHAGEQGRENELSLARVLESLVPRRLGLGSGMIIDSADGRSTQTDIVVYDLADQPTLMAQSSQVIFPVEVVHAAVEVKTTLTAEELVDCGKKRERLHRLQPQGGRSLPPFAVLAYEAWASPETVAKHLRALPLAQRPDVLCVLNPGIVAGDAAPADPANDYAVALVPLHARTSEGVRRQGEWWTLEGPPPSGSIVEAGFTYPATFVAGRKAVVGEPGRALLLFCDSLLRLLFARGAIPSPVLGHYLTPVARDVHLLP